MIYGNINDLADYTMLRSHPIWNQAFEAIQALPRKPKLGITELLGKDMFINIMKYDTVKPEHSRFEAHRRYVDLQFSLGGAERIEWKRVSNLIAHGEYDKEKIFSFIRRILHRRLSICFRDIFLFIFPVMHTAQKCTFRARQMFLNSWSK